MAIGASGAVRSSFSVAGAEDRDCPAASVATALIVCMPSGRSGASGTRTLGGHGSMRVKSQAWATRATVCVPALSATLPIPLASLATTSIAVPRCHAVPVAGAATVGGSGSWTVTVAL